jgi:serine/threonine protein kinase
VHRDIKPGNLLIMADGTTKITDFGIAKANVQDVNLTATGIVMGTALYVSPEQATGQPLGGSSDVYSLGVVAYECLAGDPPFVADQPLAIAIMHKHDPVPPLPPDVPRPIADLVYQMLAKNPEDRPESARHVADRADVIRDARHRNGYNGPVTADLPVVPNYPPTTADFYQTDAERGPAARAGSRSLLYAGIGAAAIGVIAIVAVLLSSNNDPSPPIGGSTTISPPSTSPVARASSSASGTQPGSTAGSVPPGVTLGPTSAPASLSRPASPTGSHKVTPTTTTKTGSGSPTGTGGSTGSGSPTGTGSGSPTDTGSGSPTDTGSGSPTDTSSDAGQPTS